nr:S-layer homology domain-containing protein [Paenibacillus sp. B01]
MQTVRDAIAAAGNESRSFRDVGKHWASGTIAKAAKLRIAGGYADGTFRPNAPVTRAEFAAMIARAFGLAPSPASNVYADAASSWAAGSIGALADKGIIAGYADGSFRPNDPLTRAELVKIISQILNLNTLAKGSAAGFADVRGDHWAAEEIRLASSASLVQGISSSRFAPDDSSSRAEALTILLRALESDLTIKAMIDAM